MLALIPDILEPNDHELLERARACKIEVIAIQHIRDLFPYIVDQKPVIGQINAPRLRMLCRNASELLSEVPLIVTGVPTCIYTQDWLSAGNTGVVEGWDTFRRRLQKSGTTATSPEEMSLRSDDAKRSDVLTVDTPEQARTDARLFKEILDAKEKEDIGESIDTED